MTVMGSASSKASCTCKLGFVAEGDQCEGEYLIVFMLEMKATDKSCWFFSRFHFLFCYHNLFLKFKISLLKNGLFYVVYVPDILDQCQ